MGRVAEAGRLEGLTQQPRENAGFSRCKPVLNLDVEAILSLDTGEMARDAGLSGFQQCVLLGDCQTRSAIEMD
jgi:hypothetical protein